MYYAHNNTQMIYRDVDCVLKENFQLQESKQIFLFLVRAAAVRLIDTLAVFMQTAPQLLMYS